MKFLWLTAPLLMGLFACSEQSHVIKEIPFPAEHSSLPFLSTTQDELQISWVEEKSDSNHFYYSSFEENAWSTPQLITSGTDWFVNWADYPMVFKNEKGAYYAHYLKKSAEDTYAYDVQLMYSADGTSWHSLGKLHDDTTKTEHGFVSAAATSGSTIIYNWLDGRATKGSHHGAGSMTLRSSVVSGQSISPSEEIDARTCDCCQTSMAASSFGEVLVFRDRSEMELRDIYYSTRKDGQWSIPKAVHHDNWKITGCPVNGPQVAVDEENMAVCWFTAAAGKPSVKLSFSTFMSDSFGHPIILDDTGPLGRVDLTWISSQSVAAVWLSQGKKGTQVMLGIVDQRKGLLSKRELLTVDSSRSSGFPQLAWDGKQLVLAMTDVSDESKKVRTFQIKI